jgi:hypothetical protein
VESIDLLTLVPRRLVLVQVDVDVVKVDALLRQRPPDAVRVGAEARAEVDDVADVGMVAALAVCVVCVKDGCWGGLVQVRSFEGVNRSTFKIKGDSHVMHRIECINQSINRSTDQLIGSIQIMCVSIVGLVGPQQAHPSNIRTHSRLAISAELVSGPNTRPSRPCCVISWSCGMLRVEPVEPMFGINGSIMQ